ncbi:MAG: MFS transporter [Planctomycetes bacterium]|nr:MFS transporter [Planctomycetota bacterium]
MAAEQAQIISPSGGHRYRAVVAACASLFVFAVSATILPAILPRAAGDFRIAPETLAWAASTQFAAFFLATIIGGVLSDRLGKKPVLLVGCVMLILGAVIWFFASRPAVAHVGAAFLGMGGGILESMGSALLADLYPDKRKFVLNFSQVAFCAGAIAGPAIMSELLPQGISWRIFFAAEAAIGAALLALFCLAPVPRAPTAREADLGDSLRMLRKPSVYLPALALFCYVLAESGVVIYANLYLRKQHSAPEEWAILSISLVWGAMLVGRLVCAALPESLPTGRLIAVLSILTAASLAAQGLARDWVFSFAVFGINGLLLSGIWPLIVAQCAGNHPERTGSTVGIVVAVGSLGVVLAPMLVSPMLQSGCGIYVFPALALVMLAAATTCSAKKFCG